MKKAVSILLLLVFLFNVGGYYLAFWALEYKVDQELTVRIDRNDYASEETFELKIPITLPYPTFETEYERADGKFEYNGQFYKLVKQKFQKDTLYIVCIQNHEQKELSETISDYVKITNDLPGTAKKALNFFGKLLKEYHPQDGVAISHGTPWVYTAQFCEPTCTPITQLRSIPSPPPKG